MDLYGLLFLLVATSVATLADVISYVPKLSSSVQLNLTSSTFVLDQPQCIFSQQYATNDVWLVVALDSVEPQLTDANLSIPVDYSSFSTNKYYHTLRVSGKTYPCFNESQKYIAVLLVGADVNCTNPFCNSPLTSPGPYRVRFVVLNNKGIIAKTERSELVTLTKEKNSSVIDPLPQRRSGGMIVITCMLSVLLAILLVCLTAALCLRSKGICWSGRFNNEGKWDPVVDNIRHSNMSYKRTESDSFYSRDQYVPWPRKMSAHE
ncbi:uroplakin-3b-like [Rhinophrynus dorsalis]